jgi:hypothetical protein
MSDKIDHPDHYNWHPSGAECIEIAEHFNFNLGNAIKYIWRAGRKGDAGECIKKAAWYLDRENTRLENEKQDAEDVRTAEEILRDYPKSVAFYDFPIPDVKDIPADCNGTPEPTTKEATP